MRGVEITYLEGVNSIVIKGKDKAFMTTKDAVIFDRDMLTQMIVMMLVKGYLDHNIFDSILEEINTT